MFEYDKDTCEAAKTLDKYDLTKTIKYCNEERLSLGEIYDSLGGLSKDIADASYELTPDELMMYLSDRYGVQWREVIRYEICGIKSNDSLR